MNITELVLKQRKYYNSGATRSLSARLDALSKLRTILTDHEDELYAALKSDLNKSQEESYMTEIGFTLNELTYMEKHLKSYIKNKRVSTPLMQFPASSYKCPEPYGVTLIMSPWNYPVMLLLAPLIGALAAGNTAILKPSAYSPATSEVISTLIKTVYPEELVAVVTGGREQNNALLEEKFDYIFFTGSPNVGKLVMKKASAHLTPVSLELGGKSPCIVDKTANIELAARRICFGKYLNSGQTCIAPDYLLVHNDVKDELIKNIINNINMFFGKEPLNAPHLVKIINERHFKRILGLIENENIVCGGTYNENTHQIAPTIVDNITFDSKIMQEEIFGPILPVITYTGHEQIVNYITNQPKPLAFYLFTSDKSLEKMYLNRCSFGGGCINDTIMHIASDTLPFGGVGNSGMGSYHGKQSFDCFTHYKSVLKKATWLDIPIRYYPFSKKKLNMMKKFMH